MTDDREQLEMLICQYADGQLSDEALADLERRLEQDPELREELRLYRALGEKLTDMKGMDLAEQELTQLDYDVQRASIMEAVERRALLSGQPRRRILLFRPMFAGLAAAAAVLVVASVSFFAYFNRPAGQNTDNRTGPLAPIAKVAEAGAISVAVLKANTGEVKVEYPRVDMMDLPLGRTSDTVAASTAPPGTVTASVKRTHPVPRKAPAAGPAPMLNFFD